MREWLYVAARVDFGPGEPQRSWMNPGNISFYHCFVEARTEDEAYRKGYAVACGDCIFPASEDELINDYVVELEAA